MPLVASRGGRFKSCPPLQVKMQVTTSWPAASLGRWVARGRTSTLSDNWFTSGAHSSAFQVDTGTRHQVAKDQVGCACSFAYLPGSSHCCTNDALARTSSVQSSQTPWVVTGETNVESAFRRVQTDTEFEWVVPHTYRKTVATMLDQTGLSARTIADQLGHSRISMTPDVYMGRRAVDKSAAVALEGFFAQPNPCHVDTPQMASTSENGGLREPK